MELNELSQLVDLYAEARNARLAKEKEVDTLKEHENDLKGRLIDVMRDQAVSTVGGEKYVVTHRVKSKPIATDWAQVYTFIQQNDAFDLLQKRLNESAVKLRWEDEIVIPGVTVYPVDELSISKPKR